MYEKYQEQMGQANRDRKLIEETFSIKE